MCPSGISNHLSDAKHLERNAKVWTSGERAIVGKQVVFDLELD